MFGDEVDACQEGPAFALTATMNVGVELADARRKLGLSLEEVAARTKISVDRLNAIERMDTNNLPSPIYLKGYLRTYATEVQLDTEVVTERYLSALNAGIIIPLDSNTAILDEFEVETATGSRVDAPAASRIDTPPASRLDARPAEEVKVATRVPPASPLPRTGRPSEPRKPFFDPPAEPPEPPVERFMWLDSSAHVDDPADRLSARPYFASFGRPEPVQARVRRRSAIRSAATMVAVLTVAVVAGWLIGQNYDAIAQQVQSFSAAVSANRLARRNAPAETPARTARPDASDALSERRGVKTPEPPSPRMPPDEVGRTSAGDRSKPLSDVIGRDSSAARAAITPETATIRRPERVVAPSVEGTSEPDTRTVERTGAPEPIEPTAPPPTRGDLTGNWTVTNRVETSSYKPFNGMNVGFQLQLRQEGNRVSGTGHKWMENGRPLPPTSRTPIVVSGTIVDGKVSLSFTERGLERTSAGTFLLDMADESTLTGTFSSDAADSQGTSLARRQSWTRRQSP